MYTAKPHRGVTGREGGHRVQVGQGVGALEGGSKTGQDMEEAGFTAETQTQRRVCSSRSLTDNFNMETSLLYQKYLPLYHVCTHTPSYTLHSIRTTASPSTNSYLEHYY